MTYALLPHQISLYCGHCGKEQLWETRDVEVCFGVGEFFDRTYTCRNCGKLSIRHFFYWRETADGGLFLKVGQWLPLEHNPPRELEKRFDAEDLDLYRKAFAQAAKLFAEDQDSFAAMLLAELASERRWTEAFGRSQEKLSALAGEALSELEQGKDRAVSLTHASLSKKIRMSGSGKSTWQRPSPF